MRSLARLSPALLGLALAIPTAAQADSYGSTAASTKKTKTASSPQHHRGLFRHCMCPDCQRARVKARDGVEVPAPPPIPANIVSVGDDRAFSAKMSRSKVFGRKNEGCVTCQQGTIVGAPITMTNEAPGRAVVGGAPGYAVVGNALPLTEPSPIGRVQGPASNRMTTAAASPRGKKDPSLATTGFASPTPLAPPTHNPPHIIRHLFGLDAIGHRSAEKLERMRREKHASIAYGPQNTGPVTDLPASLVYKNSR